MPIILYYNDLSPAVRGVLLTGKVLNIEFELRPINLKKNEHLTPEFLKINPQHTIPTLVDGDLIITDSHAIVAYLVAKYGKDDSLYPRDPEKKALVDQRLYFDCGILFHRIRNILYPVLILDEKEIPTHKLEKLRETYEILDKFLLNQQFLAGTDLTVADLCCVASVSTASILIPISAEKYPNLSSWYHRCKSLPYYEEANGVGLTKLDALVETALGNPCVCSK